MEGTRHERVALIAVTYVIGFITAFIAFAQQGEDPVFQETIVIKASDSARVLGASESVEVATFVNEEGLFLKVGENTKLISADYRALEESVAESVMGEPGFHYRVFEIELSPQNSHVYYCEQPDENSATCNPFVYDIVTDMIYPVLKDEQSAAFSVVGHEVIWTEDNLLSAGGGTSVSSKTPWLLSSSN